MEALAVKLGILAGLFGWIGLVGLAALLASLIWLIIRVSNLDSVLPAVICLALSIGLTVGGLMLGPAPEVQMEPLRPPWEMALDRIAQLRSGREDAKAPDGGEAPPEEEAAEPANVSERGRNRSRDE